MTPTTMPGPWPGRSGRCRWAVCSPAGSSARWAATTSCTSSRRRWRCSGHAEPPAGPRPGRADERPPGRSPQAGPRHLGGDAAGRVAAMSASPPPPTDPADREALEQRAVNVIRGLAMDAPRAANSGHPGTAMALAPLAHVLFTRVMRHDPAEPHWPDRDRFVLSNGHASILLYSMLYLTGYGLTLDDLRGFRQLGQPHPGPSRARPHPRRRGHHRPARPGLRQRRGHGDRRAVAARPLLGRGRATTTPSSSPATAASRRASPTRPPPWPATWASAGWSTSTTTTTSPSTAPPSCRTPTTCAERFAAYGWSVDDVGEVANDLDALEAALLRAMADEDRPSLIILRSHIGYPSPHLTDTAKAHGDPFSADEIRLTKEILGLAPTRRSGCPTTCSTSTGRAIPRGQAIRPSGSGASRPGTATGRVGTPAWRGHGLPGWEAKLPTFAPEDGPWPPARPSRPASTPPATPSPGSCRAAPT